MRSISVGEDILFDAETFNATNGGKPPNCVVISSATVFQQSKDGLYLWVIDQNGLRILLEATPNPIAKRGVVCHTNITGGALALQGGELWFGDDDKVYINYSSGRYGALTAVQEEAVIDYFTSLGYDVVQLGPR
ncbi:hypothetical protein [uncultured Fibrella sp.]|uniref:hypothetical protein n=1 Tax=uncultured Fibrella sp. TaxID=1284596 RepID=UPI0035CAB853